MIKISLGNHQLRRKNRRNWCFQIGSEIRTFLLRKQLYILQRKHQRVSSMIHRAGCGSRKPQCRMMPNQKKSFCIQRAQILTTITIMVFGGPNQMRRQMKTVNSSLKIFSYIRPAKHLMMTTNAPFVGNGTSQTTRRKDLENSLRRRATKHQYLPRKMLENSNCLVFSAASLLATRRLLLLPEGENAPLNQSQRPNPTRNQKIQL